MAANGERLALYTSPTTYVGPTRPDHEKPYASIVGLRLGNTALMAQGHVSVKDELTISVNPLFSNRPIGYFASYYLGDADKIYNCHLTAACIRPDVIGSINYHDAFKRASNIMSHGQEYDFSKGLPLGMQGVIGDRNTGEAYHSVIGLGKDNPYFLQTMDRNGPMGLARLDYLRDEIDRAYAILDIRIGCALNSVLLRDAKHRPFEAVF